MRTTGCGGGAQPARHPPGPCPGPPAPSGRPLRHCRGGAGETRAPQKRFLRSKLKLPLRATVCPTRAWGTLPARPPPPTRMPRGHTGLLKAVRSHVTFVGLMQGRGIRGAQPWLRSPGQVEDSLTFPGPRPTLRSLPGRGLSGPLGSATSLLTPLRRHLRGSGRGQAARASPRLQSRPPLQDKKTQEGFEGSTLYGAPPLPLSLSPPSPGQVYNSLWQEGTL